MKPNDQKITREFCKGKTLIFYPQTQEEAAFIQRRIFALGFKWPSGSTEVGKLADCVSHGILLNAGSVLYHSPASTNLDVGLLCTSAQFDENHLPPEQVFIREQFNKLAARIEEIAKDVAEIKKELQPARLDKPLLKNPGQEQAP